MRKRGQAALQQITDAEWRTLAPKLWDVVPQVTYDWKMSQDVEDKLRTLIPREDVSFADLVALGPNQALRNHVAARLTTANASEIHKLSIWIIQDWGRIKQEPPISWARSLVGFAPETVEMFVTERGVERLPSWSKLLAFADSEKYAIYDTRVAIALNIALRAIGETRQFHLTEGRNVIVTRAAAALGKAQQPLGYLDYLAFLRALVSERGQTFLSAETTLFAAGPHLAEKLVATMDEHLAAACSMSCAP